MKTTFDWRSLLIGVVFQPIPVSVPVYAWVARGIGHADGLDWAPNSVGARCLLRHHVHSAFFRPPIESWSLVAVYRGVTRAVSH